MSTPKKLGRPGAGRAKDGRIRAAVKPQIRIEAEQLVETDIRLRSVSQLVEAALAFYIAEYRAADGHLDNKNFPILRPTDGPPPARRRSS